MHVQREDALSAATSARFAQASHIQVEDGLVQRTRLGSSSTPSPPPVSQMFVPPPPPPPPAFVPPPPPPPPPVLPPSQGVVLRPKPTRNKGDRKKRDSGPQLSMAEVVAKAKKMREARERVLSVGSSASANQENSEDPFESVMQARVVQLKSRRVDVPQQAPRQEEDSELMREMRRKAQRASRAFAENEKFTHITIEDGELPPDSDRKTSRAFSSSSSSRDTGDNDSLQSLENAEKLESPKEVNDFVDSLFDPVLSQGVEGLSNEIALQGALKGGGGVNQPSTTAASSSSTGTFTTTATINGNPVGQGNGYPAAHVQGNGYPAAQVQGNGYPGLIPGSAFPGMVPGGLLYSIPQTNGPLFPGPNMDAAMLAAQQQVLIERLIAQQALLQQQQTVASQKQQEQLLQLAQQQQAQLEQMQQILAAAGHQTQPAVSHDQASASASIQVLNTAESSASAFSSTPVNGHAALQNGETSMRVPSPPPEFSDISNSESSRVPIPPRTSSLPPPPPYPGIQEHTFAVTEAFPPPPSPITENSVAADNIDAPQRPGIQRRSTDKVALAVAALELKSEEARSPGPTSPLKQGETFSFVSDTPVKFDTPSKERPDFHKRASSSLGFVLLSDKQNNTVLHPRTTGPHLSYSNVKWKFNIRKEVSCI